MAIIFVMQWIIIIHRSLNKYESNSTISNLLLLSDGFVFNKDLESTHYSDFGNEWVYKSNSCTLVD